MSNPLLPESSMAQAEASTSSRQRVSDIARQAWITSARQEGDDNSLWVSATSMWSSINNRYVQSNASGEHFAPDLHDLWFIYYQASINIGAHSSQQDRLALNILQAREQGVLSRTNWDGVEHHTDDAIHETATTSHGTIWTDLPWLVSDMTEHWTRDFAAMSGTQRLNFSSFLARLASVGVAGDRLCGIALLVLRDTLETARPLGQLDEEETENSARSPSQLSIAALLPSANAWLFYAGKKIVQLTDLSWNECHTPVGNLWDPSSQASATGFSPQRWVYWLQRLQEIVHLAQAQTDNSGEGLAQFALRVMDNMMLTADEIDSKVKRQLELAISRGLVEHEPSMQLLGPPRHGSS